MNATALKALKMIRKVKASVISTVKDGEAEARIIDIMHQDEEGLIFATLKTKPFYRQLQENKKVSITVMNKDYAQVRLKAEVKEIADDALQLIFDNNPSLEELFPRDGLSPFQAYRVYKGKGEIFDLSGKKCKMQRERFAFGGAEVNEAGLKITDTCISCGKCQKVCPFNAIFLNEEKSRYEIKSRFCDECGACYVVCPIGCIELSKGI